MKKLTLISLVTCTLASAAAAQTSQVSGYTALITIGSARGLQPALTVPGLKGLRPGTAAYRTVNEKLRISPGAFAELLRYGNRLAPTSLVTRAALEASTGKTLFAGAVADLIAKNPGLAASNQKSLNQLLSDPAAIAAANQAAQNAGTPVTPRGGGS